MSIFLTSDQHFWHTNILKMGKGRPFKDIDEHNEILIKNWNAVVKPGDVVYVLGDVFFRSTLEMQNTLLKRLNGEKQLILGNHDNYQSHKKHLIDGIWKQIRYYHTFHAELKNGKDVKVVLSHYPILEFDGAFRENTLHVYGHIHTMNNYDDIYKGLGFKAVHIGVDTSATFPNTMPFSPINLEDAWKKANDIVNRGK